MTFVSILDSPLAASVVDDWSAVFADAIHTAQTGGHAGVLVPARAAPYTVRKPMVGPSIDLTGQHDFVLKGEGPQSVITMIGSGSWRLLFVGDGATDVVVRDLRLDGSQSSTKAVSPT